MYSKSGGYDLNMPEHYSQPKYYTFSPTLLCGSDLVHVDTELAFLLAKAHRLIVILGFVKEIKELIYKCQYEALKSVNRELINLYWEIGKEITNQQKEKGWGKSVVEVLARELQC